MNVVLQLKCVGESRRAVAALWLAHDSVAGWLAEVARWPTSHSDLRLLIVPGEANGTTSGALVTFPANDAVAIQACFPAGVAYGRVGERLFVPLDARFEPPVTDEEIAMLLPADDSAYVWHPTRGLIRCDHSARYELGQLLQMPPLKANSWDRAAPGITLNDRLFSIEPSVSPEIEKFLESARGDIGTQAGGLRRLPLTPTELRSWRWILSIVAALFLIVAVLFVLRWILSAGGLDWQFLWGMLAILAIGVAVWFLLPKILDWIKRAAAKGWASHSSSNRGVSRGSASSGGRWGSWFAGAGRWVAARAAALDEQLDALRHREINRLLHMLDARPDEGLRYAIPMAGEASHRGVVAGGFRLIERLVEFSLGGLGGGAPAAYWSISAPYQARLIAKYRELANREIALGRHRRAAYIFAELLNDLRSAAQTLADGGYFREAAALYEKRLKDSHAAAQCLERGGLLPEAIAIYNQFGNHEKVGELYERLERWDFAEQAYERALQAKLNGYDFLGAANLAENKLHQPDKAFQILSHGWPGTAQAALCLEESFKLLGRRAAHEQASKRLIQLSNEYGNSDEGTQLATCFALLANLYPDSTFRTLAADQTRVLVARRLTEVSDVERRKLLQAVQQLVPQDRLLARDCSQFQNLSRANKRPGSAVGREEFKLPSGVWKKAIAVGEEFYAAGYRGDEVLLIRGLWDGTLQEPTGQPWKYKITLPDAACPIQLGCSGQDAAKILVLLLGEKITTDRQFPRTDRFRRRIAGGHAAFDRPVIGMNVSQEGILDSIAFQNHSVVVASHVVKSGELIYSTSIQLYGGSSMAIDSTEFDRCALRIPSLVSRFNNEIIVADSSGLFRPEDPFPQQSFPLPSSATTMFPWKSATDTFFVALLESGAFVWFGHPLKVGGSHFAEEMVNPVGCCIGDDLIVLADSELVQIYKLESPTVRLIATRHGPFETPIALLPEPTQKRVALFLSDGRVLLQAVGDVIN